MAVARVTEINRFLHKSFEDATRIGHRAREQDASDVKAPDPGAEAADRGGKITEYRVT